MPSTYHGRRETRPWLWPRIRQCLATLHCGRVGHDYSDPEPVTEGGQLGAVRRCAHGCGCMIVEVTRS